MDPDTVVDEYSVLPVLHVPGDIVEEGITDEGWVEEYGEQLDWMERDWLTIFMTDRVRDYMEDVADTALVEHSDAYEEDGYWEVKTVVYHVEGLDVVALLEKEYVDHVWLGPDRVETVDDLR